MPHPVTSNYAAVPRLIGCRPYGAARNHGAGPDHINVHKTPHLPHYTDQQQPYFSSLPPLLTDLSLHLLIRAVAPSADSVLTSSAMGSSAEDIAQLRQYNACDISDALLKLKVPGAGFVADLNLYSPPAGDSASVTIAPVSTVLFAAKGQDLAELASNIPKGVHWADLTVPGTIVVLKQPEGQKNAICGGIMAVRMKVCQAEGIIVAGRARDIGELKSTALPVSASSSQPCQSLIRADLGTRALHRRRRGRKRPLGHTGAARYRRNSRLTGRPSL